MDHLDAQFATGLFAGVAITFGIACIRLDLDRQAGTWLVGLSFIAIVLAAGARKLIRDSVAKKRKP